MIRATFVAVGAIALATGVPVAAEPGRTTGTLPVSLNLNTSCTLRTTPLDFGTAVILTFPIDSTARIALECAPGTAYSVGIDDGRNFNGNRRMYAGGTGLFRYVNYQVYRNAARTLVWGQGAGQTVTGVIPAGGRTELTAYGRVPFNVVLPTGYVDTLTVTLTF